MKVKDIMSKDVVIADANDTVASVAKLMAHHNIGCIPVTENGQKVLGVITDRDIVINMTKFLNNYEDAKITNFMSNKVYSIKPDADIADALDLMKKHQVRRLPVIDDDVLIGMLSLGDLAVYAQKADYEISDTLSEISVPLRAENI